MSALGIHTPRLGLPYAELEPDLDYGLRDAVWESVPPGDLGAPVDFKIGDLIAVDEAIALLDELARSVD